MRLGSPDRSQPASLCNAIRGCIHSCLWLLAFVEQCFSGLEEPQFAFRGGYGIKFAVGVKIVVGVIGIEDGS